MKLKKLLCGVTAAIMALSSVAIASFTSASAANADGLIDPPSGGWLTKADQADPSQYHLVYSFNSPVAVPDVYQAKELYIAFKIVNVNVNHPLKAYMAYSIGEAWTSYEEGTANPAT